MPSAAAREQAGDGPARRRELLAQLSRLQDLYVLGDLTKGQDVMRRQALEVEIERIGPPKLLAQLFDRIWQEGDHIVAVKPHAPFVRYSRP